MPQAKKPAEPEDIKPDEAEARIKFNGQEYTLQPIDRLNFEDIEALEEAFNLPFEEIDQRRAKFQRWMIFLALRRAGATVDDRPVEFADLGALEYSANPDDAGSEGPTTEADTPAE